MSSRSNQKSTPLADPGATAFPHCEFEREFWDRDQLVAGVDEAGRGALAGPVVAAAVILHPGCGGLPGVRDSKLVAEAERELLYDRICTSCLSWGVGIVSAQRIDEINILQATLEAMRIAVESCSTQPQHLLIDGNRYQASIIPYRTIVRGDAISLSIAAASLVAKVTRDRIMRQLHDTHPVYQFHRHKGYGTAAHRSAVREFGALAEHRVSFLGKILSPQEELFKD